MKNTKLSSLTFKFDQGKLYLLTQYHIKMKITTSKQLYMENLQTNKHYFTVNQTTQDL